MTLQRGRHVQHRRATPQRGNQTIGPKPNDVSLSGIPLPSYVDGMDVTIIPGTTYTQTIPKVLPNGERMEQYIQKA